MSDDLVQRLRRNWMHDDGSLCEEAADRIEHLQKVLEGAKIVHESDQAAYFKYRSRSEALEAALREIRDLPDYSHASAIERAYDIASLALEGSRDRE